METAALQMINLKYPVVLASNSPRRKELLEKLEIPFTVQTVDVIETIPNHVSPLETALYLANLKSTAHAHLAINKIVITSDTIVLSNNKILGKPTSDLKAFEILESLAGKTHKVITAICLRVNNDLHSFDVSTEVSFGPISPKEIQHYIQSGRATDKAGAYGIQDWIGMIAVEKINGSYYNVMGLPVYELYLNLKKYYSL